MNEPDDVVTDRRAFMSGAAALSAVASAGALAGPATAATPSSRNVVMDRVIAPLSRVRFGFIGVGGRGHELMRLMLAVEGAEVVAVCDTDAAAVTRAVDRVVKAQGQAPKTFSGGPHAYRDLVALPEVDAVLIATPWEWHLPMAVDAMNAGKQTFLEVPAVMNVDDAWQLVETSEKRGVNCMMLENCVYDESELMLLNIVRAGLLGEIVHAEGGYMHDLRQLLLDRPDRGEGKWRTRWYQSLVANSYPTHGLGPIAFYMDINRGDKFDHLVSMGSPARSMDAYADRFPVGDPRREARFVMSDVNTSIITTARGCTIMLQHAVSSPMPYSRLNRVNGTAGTFHGYPDRLALDSYKQGEEWIEDLAAFRARYGSKLWASRQAEASRLGGGHGGMDYVMLWRVVYCLRNGLPLDQNVYDAASWSAIVGLGEASARARGRTIECPDFTRGAWKAAKPVLMEGGAVR